jgi:hypothetical protein
VHVVPYPIFSLEIISICLIFAADTFGLKSCAQAQNQKESEQAKEISYQLVDNFLLSPCLQCWRRHIGHQLRASLPFPNIHSFFTKKSEHGKQKTRKLFTFPRPFSVFTLIISSRSAKKYQSSAYRLLFAP